MEGVGRVGTLILGTYTYDNDEKYEGEWKGGKMEGNGKFGHKS